MRKAKPNEVTRIAGRSPRAAAKPVEDSRTRLVDAAEQLMRDEGYAAVTSRRVASKAGLKPQLVHYYFATMDELFIAVMERGAEENTLRLSVALADAHPLQSFWQLCAEPRSNAISAEFVALANHRKNIRARVTQYAERFRTMQINALSKILKGNRGGRGVLPPSSLAFLMESIARVIVMERSLGMSRGHAETVALMQRYIKDLERPGKPANAARRAK